MIIPYNRDTLKERIIFLEKEIEKLKKHIEFLEDADKRWAEQRGMATRGNTHG